MNGHSTELERARAWVERAVAAGQKRYLVHCPAGHPQAGRRYYHVEPESGPGCPGNRPQDRLAGIREVLYRTRRACDYRNGDFVKRTETVP
jgi:hypothetical protein